MSRPTTIRDEDIVEAARQVFLARGIRATTADVAERAGVSEGTIFKRFKSKVELFQAAMRPHVEEPPFFRTLGERVGQGEVHDNLNAVGLEIVDFFRTITPLMMMAWSNPGSEGIPCMMNEPNPPPLRILRALSGFFEAEMRNGRLRRHDPEIVARTFIGAIHNFVVFEVMFKSEQVLPMPPETFIRGLVNLLSVGADPAEASP